MIPVKKRSRLPVNSPHKNNLICEYHHDLSMTFGGIVRQESRVILCWRHNIDTSNRSNCLLLWRMPTPGPPPGVGYLIRFSRQEIKNPRSIPGIALSTGHFLGLRPAGGRNSDLYSGRTTKKVVPSLILDSTQMRPSWLSTMDLTIAKPSPVPGTPFGALLAR